MKLAGKVSSNQFTIASGLIMTKNDDLVEKVFINRKQEIEESIDICESDECNGFLAHLPFHDQILPTSEIIDLYFKRLHPEHDLKDSDILLGMPKDVVDAFDIAKKLDKYELYKLMIKYCLRRGNQYSYVCHLPYTKYSASIVTKLSNIEIATEILHQIRERV